MIGRKPLGGNRTIGGRLKGGAGVEATVWPLWLPCLLLLLEAVDRLRSLEEEGEGIERGIELAPLAAEWRGREKEVVGEVGPNKRRGDGGPMAGNGSRPGPGVPRGAPKAKFW